MSSGRINVGTTIVVVPCSDDGAPYITTVTAIQRVELTLGAPRRRAVRWHQVYRLPNPLDLSDHKRMIDCIGLSSFHDIDEFEWDIRARCWKIYLK